jgi:hypothetical protein
LKGDFASSVVAPLQETGSESSLSLHMPEKEKISSRRKKVEPDGDVERKTERAAMNDHPPQSG